MSLPKKACHNCRRRRLRCDRSLPHCHKCTNAGQECLGYETLFIWTWGVATRGKMSGMTFEDRKRQQGKQECPRPGSSSTRAPRNRDIAVITGTAVPGRVLKLELQASLDHGNLPLQAKLKALFDYDIIPSLGRPLTDPFFQDLNQDAKFYISHFNHNVCKDLVIYDFPKQNPFRDLIPMATQHPVLLNILIANSALNISNASQRSVIRPSPPSFWSRATTRTIPQSQISSSGQSSRWYKDALIAKQRSLQLLNSALYNIDSTGIDVALGSVLLFTEFELADFGTKDWRPHIHGARALINTVEEPYKLQYSNMSPLRRFLISNCVVYDVLSSTLGHLMAPEPPRCSSDMVRSSLQYAEANNYLSFPAVLLEAALITAQLLQAVQDGSPAKPITSSQEHRTISLLHTAQSFDTRDWASTIQSISPQCDLESRIHIASAHKAAVCIYMSRVLLFLSPTAEVQDNLGPLVSDIIHHLSFVTSDSELFKATSWPTFVAGADARDPNQQTWAMARLRELWECLPCTMGYVRSAMEILGGIWTKRDAAGYASMDTIDWVQELKLSEIDIMIA